MKNKIKMRWDDIREGMTHNILLLLLFVMGKSKIAKTRKSRMKFDNVWIVRHDACKWSCYFGFDGIISESLSKRYNIGLYMIQPPWVLRVGIVNTQHKEGDFDAYTFYATFPVW